MLKFTTGVRQFSRKATKNLEYAVREGTRQTLIESNTPVAQGGPMPVKTGWLRGSLSIAFRGEPRTISSVRDPDAWQVELNGYKAGRQIRAGWTAPHAEAQEYGSRGGKAHGFYRKAAIELPIRIKAIWNKLNAGS